MIIVTGYKNKRELKNSIGKPLMFKETSFFGPEYKSTGHFAVAHRPAVTGLPGREFFAEIKMENDLIVRVI